MEASLKPGKYVLAVSGGVDSMVLLDLLAKQPGIELVVAHFNHGMRPEALQDEQFVSQKANQLEVVFEAGYGRLGAAASEDAARKARYKFLYAAQGKYKAKAVITAHHQDDLIETALLNSLRGTGRKGITAILSNETVLRPLLGYSKDEIILYARQNHIEWREDSTNNNALYLRNRLRSNLAGRLTPESKQDLLNNIDKVANVNDELDVRIARLSQTIYTNNLINRGAFSLLPTQVADELVAYWLRVQKVTEFDRKTIKRVSTSLRTFKANTSCPVARDTNLKISQKTARFSHSI